MATRNSTPTFKIEGTQPAGFPKPKRCPFCSDPNNDADIVRHDYVDGRRFYVEAQCCGARGPEGETPLVAVEKWNRRKTVKEWRAEVADHVADVEARGLNARPQPDSVYVGGPGSTQ
jgi:hypothetical protein